LIDISQGHGLDITCEEAKELAADKEGRHQRGSVQPSGCGRRMRDEIISNITC